MASTSTLSDSKHLPLRRQSCDTVCSSNSSCLLHKRKPVHPLANSIRTYVARNNNSTIKQRVLSARLLKLRSLQNQLNDANFHLTELQQENKALRNLQTRQDKALSRYEGANADLPRLLKGHEEEVKVLTAKNKTLRKNLKDVTDLLKIKEDELASAREQVKSLNVLVKQKNLGERHALVEEVESLKEKLKASDDTISLLNRKIHLEAKNSKHKLNTEMVKHKQAQKDLLQALGEIDRLTGMIEAKNKFTLPNNRKRFSNVARRESVSLITLTSDDKSVKESNKVRELLEQPRVSFDLGESSKLSSTRTASAEDDTDNQSDHCEVKLEPITNEKDARIAPSGTVMVSPTESIKARLSVSSSPKSKDVDQLSKCIEHMNVFDNGINEPTHIITVPRQKSRPNSSKRLEKIADWNSFDTFLQKPYNTQRQNDIEKNLGNTCTQMLSTVKDCGAVVDSHLLDFQTSKTETEKLLQSLREADSLNSQLRHSNFLNTESFEIPEKDLALVKQIWTDEYDFQKNTKSSKENAKEYESLIKSDRNGNVIKKEVEVAPEDKTKLLATLRAIDNGDNVDELTFDSAISNRKNKLVNELFGDFHK